MLFVDRFSERRSVDDHAEMRLCEKMKDLKTSQMTRC